MKKMIFSVFILSIFLIAGCNSFGKEKTFKGVQLFYTSDITASEADNLGKYLIDSEFADGTEKTVQLAKSGSTYQFRMVVKKGIDTDPEYIELGPLMAAEISTGVFNGAKVEVHYCDDQLKTLRVMQMPTN